jgi:hypothetical protein
MACNEGPRAPREAPMRFGMMGIALAILAASPAIAQAGRNELVPEPDIRHLIELIEGAETILPLIWNRSRIDANWAASARDAAESRCRAPHGRGQIIAHRRRRPKAGDGSSGACTKNREGEQRCTDVCVMQCCAPNFHSKYFLKLTVVSPVRTLASTS